MGFMIFIPLILIGGIVGMFLEKIYNAFLYILELLFAPSVFRVAVTVLLVLSVLLLAVLLFFLFLWKRAGRMSRAYRKSLPLLARLGLSLVNLTLILWVFWQCLLVLLCVICLTA